MPHDDIPAEKATSADTGTTPEGATTAAATAPTQPSAPTQPTAPVSDDAATTVTAPVPDPIFSHVPAPEIFSHVPAPQLDTGYTAAGVPTFEGVREKIETRFGTALGATELAEETTAGRTADQQFAARQRAAAEKLEEIRASMHKPD